MSRALPIGGPTPLGQAFLTPITSTLHPWKVVDASDGDGAKVSMAGNYNLIFPEPAPSGLDAYWLPRIDGEKYNADPRPTLPITANEVGIYLKIVLEDVAASTSALWGYGIAEEPELVAEPTSAPPAEGELLAVTRIALVTSAIVSGSREISAIENEAFFPLGYRRDAWWQHLFWSK